MENALKRGLPLLLLLAAAAAFGNYQSPASTPSSHALQLPSFQSPALEPQPEVLLIYDEQGTLDTLEIRPGGTPATYTYEAVMCLGEPAISEGGWSQNGVTFPEGNKLQDGATAAFAGWSGIGFWGHNRYYDPELGRFTQTDPMGYADSMNLYAAFGQSPMNFTDPMGDVIVVDSRETADSIVKILKRIFRGVPGANIHRIMDQGRIIITGDIAKIKCSTIFGAAIGEWMERPEELRIEYVDRTSGWDTGGATTNEFANGVLMQIAPEKAYKGHSANIDFTPETTFIHELGHAMQLMHPEITKRAKENKYGRITSPYYHTVQYENKDVYSNEIFALFFENLYRASELLEIRNGYLYSNELNPPYTKEGEPPYSNWPDTLWDYDDTSLQYYYLPYFDIPVSKP